MRKNLSNDHWFFFDKKKWIYINISMNRTQTKGLRSKRRNSPYIFLVVTSQYQRKLVILKHFTIDWIKWLTIKLSKTTKLQRALWHIANESLLYYKHFTIDWIKWLTIKQSKTTKLQRALWHLYNE